MWIWLAKEGAVVSSDPISVGEERRICFRQLASPTNKELVTIYKTRFSWTLDGIVVISRQGISLNRRHLLWRESASARNQHSSSFCCLFFSSAPFSPLTEGLKGDREEETKALSVIAFGSFDSPLIAVRFVAHGCAQLLNVRREEYQVGGEIKKKKRRAKVGIDITT